MIPDYVLQDPGGDAAVAYRKAALRDVAAIIEGSNILAHLQNVEVALRRALSIVANARLYELRQGWQTATAHEVLAQVMSEITFKKVCDDGIPDARAVNAVLLRVVIPSLDMLGAEMEALQRKGVEVDQIYQDICRSNESGAAGLAEVQRTTDNNEGETAGCGGEGAQGEGGGT